MKKRIFNLVIAAMFVFAVAARSEKGDNSGRHLAVGQQKQGKIKWDKARAQVIFEDDEGRPTVVVPVQNPKAREKINAHAGAATTESPAPPAPEPAPAPSPVRLVISNLENVTETIASQRGILNMVPRDGPNAGITLGYYFLGPFLGVSYVDGQSNCCGYGTALVLIASYVGSGDMVIQAGETMTLTYDGAQTLTVTFPVTVTVASDTAAVLFLDTAGKLYWDEALSNPL